MSRPGERPWHWSAYPLGDIREEAHFGDRLLRCFSPRPSSVRAMFEHTVATCGEREALVADGHRWTYRQLSDQVDTLAAGLARHGVGPGERVALFLGNRPEFVAAFFATQKLGAITVPIGIREQRPGLAYMLNQCQARAVLFEASLADRVPDIDEVPSLRMRIVVGGTAARAIAYDQIAVALSPAIQPSLTPPIAAEPTLAEEDTAVILYTSGTTGHPKGAMITHLGIVHSTLHFNYTMKLGPDDRAVLAVPTSHVTGLIALITTMVYAGGLLVMLPEFKAARFLDVLVTERITYTILVPAMYNLCVLQPDFGQRDLRHWRIAGFGGAPMPQSTIEQLAAQVPGLILANAYGATETTSPTTMMPLGENNSHANSVGVPLPCVRIVVMDDDGKEVADGESGELWIGGPMVVSGYWDNPTATAQSFTAGYWHSGDIGLIDTDGYVQVFDRKKDMLNRGGFKIYSVEVENTLLAFPGVVEAAVVGKPCPVLGERVHAFVQVPDGAVDLAGLRAHCVRHLADYKVPESFVVRTDPLPRNANGKLLKRLLREQLVP